MTQESVFEESSGNVFALPRFRLMILLQSELVRDATSFITTLKLFQGITHPTVECRYFTHFEAPVKLG